jgi:hypothetical protein
MYAVSAERCWLDCLTAESEDTEPVAQVLRFIFAGVAEYKRLEVDSTFASAVARRLPLRFSLYP